MPHFDIGTSITTATATVSVDVTAAAPIPPGVHHFQLVVVDDAGNKSDPTIQQVIVLDTIKPTAAFVAIPASAKAGIPFTLDGSKSSDVPPGKIVQFIWTMVD